MEWMPSSNEDRDPFEVVPQGEIGDQLRKLRLEVSKSVATALREVDFSKFSQNGVDLRKPATDIAMHAFRSALVEVVLGRQGKWVEVVNIYAAGNWPCGYIKGDMTLVVY